MKYEEKYIKRLQKLARHLKRGKLIHKYIPMMVPEGRTSEQPPIFETEEGIVFAYYTFILVELPFLFPGQWQEINGKIVHVSHPNKEEFMSCADFFGLTPKEFLHCFTPIAQIPEWGGLRLKYDAKPRDVGFNITELLDMHLRMN